MDSEQKEYQIEITNTAEKGFFEVLEYAARYYSEERVLEIAEQLRELPFTLVSHPYIGSVEEHINTRNKEYRYILYKRTNQATIKVVYYINESSKTVMIMDFFPTEMHPDQVKRSTSE